MIRAGPVGRRAARYDEDDYNLLEPYFPKEDEWCEKGHNMISHINISFDKKIIRSIQFGYLENGALVLSPTYGSSEGHSFRVVRLVEDEYMTGLSGLVICDRQAIRNLTFHTNRGKHGPFGCVEDKDMQSGSKIEIVPDIRDRCEFCGFFGSRTEYHLSSVDIYVNTTIASSSKVVKR